jgi:arylsulfatase A-like enzyme
MPSGRPNVLWIFGDQHRGQALGYEGDPNLRTPNLDRFATEALLPQGISGYPLCCPYRGALLTGRYPHHVIPGQEYPLPPDMPTVATAFNQAGYDTAWFGKWHVGGIEERHGRAAFATVPPARRGGFQRWIGYDNNNSAFDAWVHGHTESGEEIPHYQLPGYETDALTDLLIEYLYHHSEGPGGTLERPRSSQAHPQNRPFFAALSVQPPHAPYVAPERFMERHNAAAVQFRANVPPVEWVQRTAAPELAGYYAGIENLDWNFGRIRETLSVAGLTENTHIIFFSDHGDMHGSHGLFRKAVPYEEAVRVPMMIGGTTAHYGVRRGPSSLLVNHVDVAPTSLGLAGLSVPEEMVGTDYSAARLSEEPADLPDSAYLQQVEAKQGAQGIDRPWRGLVTRDGWKYVALERQPWLLFDLNTDPYELVNRAHNRQFAAERDALHERLRQWISETGDKFPLE